MNISSVPTLNLVLGISFNYPAITLGIGIYLIIGVSDISIQMKHMAVQYATGKQLLGIHITRMIHLCACVSISIQMCIKSNRNVKHIKSIALGHRNCNIERMMFLMDSQCIECDPAGNIRNNKLNTYFNFYSYILDSCNYGGWDSIGRTW